MPSTIEVKKSTGLLPVISTTMSVQTRNASTTAPILTGMLNLSGAEERLTIWKSGS